ncbi:hypothetical protein L195_g048491 [Trifolium pratense]|uniref:Uncharacterized protein n=1 Tax=Trifolium pratense TaxID=57577 RepID=A0A2K3JLG0_TRIPR|nr:hypothetical protein L195_g048491 [Trifolium pratense]
MDSPSSQQVSIVVESRKRLTIKPRTIEFRDEELQLIIEKVVDFESFRENGFELEELFEIKDAANDELNKVLAQDPANKTKTFRELGLSEFKEIEIRSQVMRVEVIITQNRITELIKAKNDSWYAFKMSQSTHYKKEIMEIVLGNSSVGAFRNM